MINNLNSIENKYRTFFYMLEKSILSKDFREKLVKMQEIDLNHYTKKVSIEELRKYIQEYKNKCCKENLYKNFLILLPGNPEIVFKICLEAIRYDVNICIGIEDFCLAQNTLIVEFINEILENCRFKNRIEIKNLLKDKEILENSKNVDKTICIGNSNLYNRLENRIDNFIFYPYGILDVFFDSEEFDGLKEIIFKYSIENQYEIEIYDDLEFEDAIEAINRDGYKFCSTLISKDKEKMDKFKQDIKSEYIVLNKNPFQEINFCLNIE